MIVAVEYLVALLIGASVGFHYSIPFAAYLISGLTIVGIGASTAILVRLAIYFRRGEKHPAQQLISEAPQFSGFAVGVLLVALQMAVLNWTKIMLPIATPFWADPLLAKLDHAVLGDDPWRVLYSLFGGISPAFDRVYVTWAPAKFLTLIILLVMPESSTKSRALVAYFILMATAALGQYLLSSAGPVFYSQLGFGNRFDGIPMEPWVRSASAYLLHDYALSGGHVGTGISAMPSVHVAIALWIALVLRSYSRQTSVLGFAYFASILIGSVLLGWHYASDALVAVILALLAWHLATALTALQARKRDLREAVAF
jgi:hypothetical protein